MEYNGFKIGDLDSLENKIFSTQKTAYDAPERAVEMLTIPGRNGAIALDQGRWENQPVTYRCGCYAESDEKFAERIAAFRSKLLLKTSYEVLTDSYNPDEFRLGLYRSGLEADTVGRNHAGEFDVEFDCKPQRFLVSGNDPKTVGEWGETTKLRGDIVTFESGETDAFKSLSVDMEPIQDLNGYDAPWVGGAGKNLCGALEIGSWRESSSVGSDYDSMKYANTARGRSPNLVPVTVPMTISIASGYQYALIVFDADQKYLGGSSFLSFRNSVYTATQWYGGGSYIAFVIKRGDNQALTEEDLANCHLQLELSSTASAWQPYENICPISGRASVETTRTGKNLLNLDRLLGTPNPSAGSNTTSPRVMDTEHYYVGLRHDNYYYPSNVTEYSVANNEVTVRGANNAYGVGFPIEVKPNTQYRVSATVEGNEYLGVSYYDANWDYISYVNDEYTLTTPSNASYAVIILRSRSTSATATWRNVQVELGSTPTAYEPYQGETYTATFDETVYGGTVDLVSGVISSELAKLTIDGSSGIRLVRSGTSNSLFAYEPITAKQFAEQSIPSNLLANYLTVDTAYNAWRNETPLVALHSSGNTLWFRLPNITTLADAQTYLASNPLEVVYPLRAPRAIQLDPQAIETLIGTNNVWSNVGAVTVEYGASPYIFYNDTGYPAKPLIVITGNGTVGVGKHLITVEGATSPVYIDCESMEIYTETGGIISGASSLVSFNTNEFPTLEAGANGVSVGSGISSVVITPRWWRL